MNKHIIRNIWRTASAAMLLLLATALGSCSNDPDPAIPYFRLENVSVQAKNVSNASELGFDVTPLVGNPALELIRYDIRSNRDWVVECNSADASWLKIHPTTGSGDGIVRFCVYDNDATTPRSTTVVFRYSDGTQTQATLAVNQVANEPYIKFYVDNADTTMITAGRAAMKYDIRVASNLDLFYSMEQNAWATFTEKSHGLFTLDLAAYPDPPTELERNCSISFKGNGEYAHITNKLDILQTIRPKITITSEDIDWEANKLPIFIAKSADKFSFKLRANCNWQINQTGTWYSFSVEAGEADTEYTIAVSVENNNDATRIDTFNILTEEILGVADHIELNIEQLGGSGGGDPMEGLVDPVKWFFDGTAGTDYSKQTQEFVENNKLLATSGTSYLSYTHTYKSNPSDLPAECARFIGGTGQPYVTGAWPGDYWLFSVPVKNFAPGTKVRFTGLTRISATGHKYWRMEYKDGSAWKPAAELQTATVNGAEITYTHTIPTTNTTIDVTATFKQPIVAGNVQFRLICAANYTSGNATLGAPNGGTMRWASDALNGFNDSPIIQVVD